MTAPFEVADDHAMRLRLRKALRSPGGRAVTQALANTRGEPQRAVQIAALANVSTSSARDHAWHLTQLGLAAKSEVPCPSSGRPVSAWHITVNGILYAKGQL